MAASAVMAYLHFLNIEFIQDQWKHLYNSFYSIRMCFSASERLGINALMGNSALEGGNGMLLYDPDFLSGTTDDYVVK